MKTELPENKIQIINLMEEYLRNSIGLEKQWENTYIKKQIDKRKEAEESFSLQDHIRGMVYSMLSSGVSWDRIIHNVDEKKGCIPAVDKIFFNYEAEKLLNVSPEELADKIKEIRCGSQYTHKQMNALILVNIPKLRKLEQKYGNIDTCYQQWIGTDGDLKPLIKQLSDPYGENKMCQMGIPLICEYLKNVGYDVGKPDRHIRRILGNDRLGFSDQKIVPEWEALDIIWDLVEKTGRSAAEVDYSLWMYCAKGYGEICRGRNPKCKECITKQYCHYVKEIE